MIYFTKSHIRAEIRHLGSSQVLNIQFPVVVLPEPIAQSTGPGRKENSEENNLVEVIFVF